MKPKTISQILRKMLEAHEDSIGTTTGHNALVAEYSDQIQQLLREARINEHQLLQHQGMNVLTKTPKSILGWSELRVEQLKKG